MRNKTILVTGGNGFIGKSVVESLVRIRGVEPARIVVPDSKRDDLRDIGNCRRLLRDHRVDVVIHLASVVGGVGFSSRYPATQYYNNILMDLQLVEAAKEHRPEKLVIVSSSCAYPRDTSYPLVEENLWGGLPEETNRAYGIGKRILTVQAEAYRKEHGLSFSILVPNNAYGPWDNFHPEYSHVIPSLIRKCLLKETPLVVWGDGTPTRDFLYVKDFAEAVVLAAEKPVFEGCINVGSGVEVRIRDLVELVMRLTAYSGEVVFDRSKPNGQPRRSVNIERARSILGFEPRYTLEEGLKEVIEWYRQQIGLA